MGRFLGWALGVGCVIAIGVAPAAAQTHVSVGVYGGSFGGHVTVGRPVYAPVYYPPVYYPPPVYPVPVYQAPVYYPAPVYAAPYYRPYYRPAYRAYGPAYRGHVVVANGRHDNGRHNGWYKNGKKGHGKGYRK